MKKIIREVDKDRGIVQVTTADERWYVKATVHEKTGLPVYQFVPSVTWIAGFYPKGIEFYKWLASKGWDEAQAIKQAAGDKGSKVHKAIEALLAGEKIEMDAKFVNPSTEQMEELTLEEWECLVSFAHWFEKVKPQILWNETVVWNEQYGYAGTVDCVAMIDGEYWIIDFKTSKSIWPEYELQISAYKHSIPDKGKPFNLGILQLGYKVNKAGWKFTVVEDKFDLFLAARQIWQNETAGEKPQQKDVPLSLQVVFNPTAPEGDTAEATPENNVEQ